MRSVALPSLAAFALGSLARVACAQSLDDAAVAARRELIEQAEAARDAGHHEQALDLATRAGALQMSASLRRFIAEEQNSLGRFAEALGSAERCVAEADRDTTSRYRAEHLAACRALASQLQTRIAHVVVHLPDDAPSDIHVRVAGTELPRALWNVPYVVTPGTVSIEVFAPGGAHVARAVSVERGTNVPVDLPVPAPEPTVNTASASSAPPPPEQPSLPPASPEPRRVESAPTTPASAHHLPAGPLVAVVGGAALLVVGGVFGAIQIAQVNALNTECGGSFAQCTPTAVNARADYNTAMAFTVTADVLYAVGAVALVAGVVGWLVSGRTQEHAHAPNVRVWGSRDAAGLAFGGAF